MTVDMQEADQEEKGGKKMEETAESRRGEICVQSANPCEHSKKRQRAMSIRFVWQSRLFLLPLFAR